MFSEDERRMMKERGKSEHLSKQIAKARRKLEQNLFGRDTSSLEWEDEPNERQADYDGILNDESSTASGSPKSGEQNLKSIKKVKTDNNLSSIKCETDSIQMKEMDNEKREKKLAILEPELEGGHGNAKGEDRLREKRKMAGRRGDEEELRIMVTPDIIREQVCVLGSAVCI